MSFLRYILIIALSAIQFLHTHNKKEFTGFIDSSHSEISKDILQTVYVFKDTVKIKDYFIEIAGIVEKYDSIFTHQISEHLIIRNNPWVIDSLAATDYYLLKKLGITSLDPKELTIFEPGEYLVIPDSLAVDSLNRLFEETYLDLNIPEFKLRVSQKNSIVYEFPVRVGRDEYKYLAMAGKVVDLKTRTGEGKIVEHSKNPVFINPSDNRRYKVTQRDDGILTSLPNIPWLVPEINGIRYGQLIHPTTNIKTLGMAYSNGCTGTSEAAAWYVYYHAPLGTRIIIRYDLEILDEKGDTLRLPNIYNL